MTPADFTTLPDEAVVAYLPPAVVDALERIGTALVTVVVEVDNLGALPFGEQGEAVRVGAVESMVATVLALRHLHEAVDTVERRVTTTADRVMVGGEVYELDGVGPYKIGASPTKHYDNEALRSRLAAALADHVQRVDPDTGELEPWSTSVGKVVDEVLRVAGASGERFNKWGAKALHALGVDLGKYAVETTWGSRKVKEHKPW